MRSLEFLSLAAILQLGAWSPQSAREFTPTVLQLNHVVPLLSRDYPYRVAAFNPAGRELRVAGFDRDAALFTVSPQGENPPSFFVEPEAVGVAPPIDFPRDRDIEIRVAGGLDASYVLYLPPSYLPDNPPPLIFAFPPFGKGGRFIQPLKASARRLGWVLVGCNDLSNGRNEVFFPTARAIIQDVRRRVVHDRRREVLLGFSGGAMGSYRLSRVYWDEFAGLVAFGGWLGVYDDYLAYPRRLAVAMINGDRDQGARENEKRDRKILEDHGVSSKVFRFRGGHTIPPAETLDRALDWLLERWKEPSVAKGDPQVLLDAAVSASEAGESNQAAGNCLELILGHASTWQAQAAEDLLAWLLVESGRGDRISLPPREEKSAHILYGKARGVSVVPARTVAYLEAGLSLAPNDGLIQSRLAFELFQIDVQSQRARELARAAVESTPEYWLGHFVKGLLADADGDRGAAITDVRRALKLAPNEFQVLCAETLRGWGIDS